MIENGHEDSDRGSPPAPPPQPNMGSWRIRRKFMAVTMVFCASVIVYVLFEDMRSRVAETSVQMAFGTLATLVTGYVLGATWDDHNARRFSGRRSRRSDGDGEFRW